MIDIHTHILPNIDDGARSIEETFNLIKEAKEAGFDAIVSTAHYKEGYYETDTPEREVWVNAIYENLQAKNIDVMLYLGNEIFLSENMIKFLEEGRASTINDTSYMLFETPLDEEPIELYDMIDEMRKYKIVPILAHPERCSYIQKDPELVYDLIQKGVLMQANFGSIIGEYGRKAQFIVRKLLENDMIHLLGTDVHRENTIYPKMPQILSELNDLIGEEKVNRLTTSNPKLVLNNKRIDIEEPSIIEIELKEKLLMLKYNSFDKLNKVMNKIAKK